MCAEKFSARSLMRKLEQAQFETITPTRPRNRWPRIGRLLDLENLRLLEVLLDEAFVIPGTRFRFGLDGIIGLIPGLGDVIAGLLSLIIPFAAWVRGVRYVTIMRMVANLAIGVLVGTVPVFGDVFDVWWKANRRNYQLLIRSIAEPHRHSWRDWGFLLLLVGAIGAIFAIPILLVVWFAVYLTQSLRW
jgi:hypothetical protein